jgi:hypothetical protein
VSAGRAVVQVGAGPAGRDAVRACRAPGERRQGTGLGAGRRDIGRDIRGSLRWYGGCGPRWHIRRDIRFEVGRGVVGGQPDEECPGELAPSAMTCSVIQGRGACR